MGRKIIAGLILVAEAAVAAYLTVVVWLLSAWRIPDPRHTEHDAMLQWAGGRFDPHAFSPKAVAFDDPRERWKIAFEHLGSAV